MSVNRQRALIVLCYLTWRTNVQYISLLNPFWNTFLVSFLSPYQYFMRVCHSLCLISCYLIIVWLTVVFSFYLILGEKKSMCNDCKQFHILTTCRYATTLSLKKFYSKHTRQLYLEMMNLSTRMFYVLKDTWHMSHAQHRLIQEFKEFHIIH